MPKGLQGTPVKEACDEPFDVPLAGMDNFNAASDTGKAHCTLVRRVLHGHNCITQQGLIHLLRSSRIFWNSDIAHLGSSFSFEQRTTMKDTHLSNSVLYYCISYIDGFFRTPAQNPLFKDGLLQTAWQSLKPSTFCSSLLHGSAARHKPRHKAWHFESESWSVAGGIDIYLSLLL